MFSLLGVLFLFSGTLSAGEIPSGSIPNIENLLNSIKNPQSCEEPQKEISKDSSCEDFYKAACDKYSESFKDNDYYEEKMDELLAEAENKTLKALGVDSFKDAFFKFSKDEGLEIDPKKEAVDSNAFSVLGRAAPMRNSYSIQKFFKDFEMCEDTVKPNDLKQLSDPRTLEDLDKRIKLASEKSSEQTLLKKESALGLYNGILSVCEAAQSDGTPDNMMITSGLFGNLKRSKISAEGFCDAQRIAQYKKDARRIYLFNGNQEQLDTAYKDFYNEYFPILTKLTEINLKGYQELNPQYREIFNKKQVLEVICGVAREASMERYNKTASHFKSHFRGSEVYATSLLDNVYENREELTKYFDKLVENMKAQLPVAASCWKDGSNGEEKFKIIWPTQLRKEHFNKSSDSFPLKTIEFNDIPASDQITQSLQNMDDSLFKEMNAFYSDAVKLGDVVYVPEGIQIQPLSMLLFKEHPEVRNLVISHELGHKLSNIFQKNSNPSCSAFFKKSLDCLKGNDSIQLQPDQVEEARADLVATEFILGTVNALPEDQRKDALLKSVGFFCVAESFSSQISIDSHPDTDLRINGIFGADPRAKAILGCSETKNKRQYKECGLASIEKKGKK